MRTQRTLESTESRRAAGRLAAIVAALALMLAACGQDDAVTEAGGDGSTDSTATGGAEDGGDADEDPQPPELVIDDDGDDADGGDTDGDGADMDDDGPETGDPTPTVSNPDQISPEHAEIAEVVTIDDTTIGVRYWNGSEPCSQANVTVTESASTVEVRLETGLHPDAATMVCIAQIVYYEIAVALDDPVGDREIAIDQPADDDSDQAGGEDGGDQGGSDEATFSVDQYIGLTLDDAMALARTEQRDFRVEREDDEQFALTADYVASRVNVEVDDGVVTAARGG